MMSRIVVAIHAHDSDIESSGGGSRPLGHEQDGFSSATDLVQLSAALHCPEIRPTSSPSSP